MIRTHSQSQDLLSLLSALPDGISDIELLQSGLPISNILRCKTALLRTSLAYTDEHRRLKSLVPIREFIKKIWPPGDQLTQPLFLHFQELLEVYQECFGNQSDSRVVGRISSNLSNIHNLIRNGLQEGHPNLKNSIYCAVHLNTFCRTSGQQTASMFDQILDILPKPTDYQLEVYLITELFNSWSYRQISDPETLNAWGSSCLDHFDETDIKCRFHSAVGTYYLFCQDNIPVAARSVQAAHSLAISTGNTRRQFDAMFLFAWIKWVLGDYTGAQKLIFDSQMLAKSFRDLYKEASALRIEAMCWMFLGNYKQGMSLCNRARDLFALCHLSGSRMDIATMTAQAEIHRARSEYVEARNIYTQLLQMVSVEHDSYIHAFTTLFLAEIEICIGCPQVAVQQKINTTKSISNSMGDLRPLEWCNILELALNLREVAVFPPRSLLHKALGFCWGKEVARLAYCLERICDASCRTGSDCTLIWATVFLAHSIQFKAWARVHKALQFLAIAFLSQCAEDTAVALFTVALEGLTNMGVHQNRAECMLHLGKIFMRRGDLQQAVELWTGARALFERSLQIKQVKHIDERLDSIGLDVAEKSVKLK